jgi:hypothetical protein
MHFNTSSHRHQVKVTLTEEHAAVLRIHSSRDGLPVGALIRLIVRRRLQKVGTVPTGLVLMRPARDQDGCTGSADAGAAIHVWFDDDDYTTLKVLSRSEAVRPSCAVRWILDGYVRTHRMKVGEQAKSGRTDGRPATDRPDS